MTKIADFGAGPWLDFLQPLQRQGPINSEEKSVMKRRTVLAGLGLAGVGGLAAPAIIRPAQGATLVGVTKTEIKIGHIVPYSGNASS
jgi:hypothetical protein